MQTGLAATRPHVVVSLTSFPEAIPHAIGAIRSILNGSILPDKVVLYLSSSEFGSEEIPSELKALSEEYPLLEVRNQEPRIRSYLKLIPALRDFPDSLIVTIDDDVDYHKHMLKELLQMHEQYPHAIIAHRAKRIRFGKPYRKWKKYRWYDFVFKRIHSGPANLATGVAGVLYPPHALKKEMLDPGMFTKLAPTTDDIWFWAAATAGGVPIIPVPFGRNKPKGLGKPKSLSLKSTNFKGKEDRNLAALNAILGHYPEIAERVGVR